MRITDFIPYALCAACIAILVGTGQIHTGIAITPHGIHGWPWSNILCATTVLAMTTYIATTALRPLVMIAVTLLIVCVVAVTCLLAVIIVSSPVRSEQLLVAVIDKAPDFAGYVKSVLF